MPSFWSLYSFVGRPLLSKEENGGSWALAWNSVHPFHRKLFSGSKDSINDLVRLITSNSKGVKVLKWAVCLFLNIKTKIRCLNLFFFFMSCFFGRACHAFSLQNVHGWDLMDTHLNPPRLEWIWVEFGLDSNELVSKSKLLWGCLCVLDYIGIEYIEFVFK